MVVFTCNNCGDSVNKAKVDKHIEYECKRKHFAVSFCCVDCLKDFNYETVRAHCECVTEEQRYSAKGFVPKPSSEKGKRKQAGWVDVVQLLKNKKGLQKDEKQLLDIITNFNNVPRKKQKFQNFCYSTAPTYRNKQYLVEKLFDMIEAEYKAQQTENANEKLVNTNNIQIKNEIQNGEINGSVKEESQEAQEKKKKSEKNPQTIKNTIDEVNNETKIKCEKNSEPQLEKKKKKKKNKEENNLVLDENKASKDISVVQNVSDLSIKSKKNKNKSEVRKLNGVSEIENNCITNDDNGSNEKTDSQLSKKEKKEIRKKRKYQQELETVSNHVLESEKELVTKKKKRKLNDNGEQQQQEILKIEEIAPVPVQSGRKFEWNEAINQALQTKKSKPISISKVMKRVMKVYHLLNETSKKTNNELEKIFMKKLKKMNVVINNDKVQLF